jgi:chemotaxis signal transduction protein
VNPPTRAPDHAIAAGGSAFGVADGGVGDLLRDRAERLALPVAQDSQAAEEHILVAELPLGDGRYALPLVDLRAAVPLKNITAVPLAPAHVIGMLRWEGQLITAFSLASVLGIRGWRRDPCVLLVVGWGARLVALDSEVIPKQIALPRAAVETARARGAGPVLEVVTGQGEIVTLLDIGRLLASKGLLA